ncbi:KAP family P-loop domain protein [Acinetobacter sp. WCHAc060033]|uniref:KAP family P-loop domain protein n=1 Tax=Acinetobacter sp. WCHAc060033 TaxID=2518624 RepID=UPI00102322BB|nr:KAP family P-loop domain protein [Acinetobacter sp. WCHAc060033]RZG81528.1 KAP family P-loop domain protein [Acinetobacter sp. WCHAc060033]
MMLNEKQERLKELLENNIKNEKVGTAIAITGSWGIGKTYFWNDFLKKVVADEQKRRHLPLNVRLKHKNIFDKKYAYVSLFGIESLADLKTAIALKMSSNGVNDETTKKLEIPPFIKRAISGLRDVRVINRDYGISASAKILESLLYFQVKDAIICFDDFERMSNKLDIKDVMGLANQLKLEKNCQIILILDETKISHEKKGDGEKKVEGESKKDKYSEYKEKLINETIKITSVEPLIRENVNDIDKQLVDLMVKFANELDIHNFRFFQKVIKLYKQFLESLDKNVAYSTKEIILVRVLVGCFLELFGQSQKIDWIDIKNGEEKLDEEKIKIYRKLKKISYNIVRIDPLFLEFEKIFQQVGSFDSVILTDIAKKEWLNKSNLDKNAKFESLTEKYYEENFTKDDLDNLMELIRNNVNLFSGYQLKKTIEFLCDENKEEIFSLIKPYIKRLYLEGGKTKAQLKEEYGGHFETFIDILDECKVDTIIDEKSIVLYKVINSGFDSTGSDPKILESFSKDDWNEFLGQSRAEIFPKKYRFDNLNRVLKSVRFLYKSNFIPEQTLKSIEGDFVTILNDLMEKVDENEPQELRLRFEYWKKKLELGKA